MYVATIAMIVCALTGGCRTKPAAPVNPPVQGQSAKDVSTTHALVPAGPRKQPIALTARAYVEHDRLWVEGSTNAPDGTGLSIHTEGGSWPALVKGGTYKAWLNTTLVPDALMTISVHIRPDKQIGMEGDKSPQNLAFQAMFGADGTLMDGPLVRQGLDGKPEAVVETSYTFEPGDRYIAGAYIGAPRGAFEQATGYDFPRADVAKLGFDWVNIAYMYAIPDRYILLIARQPWDGKSQPVPTPDGKIVSVTVQSREDEFRYVTGRGVAVGSTVQDVLDRYGSPSSMVENIGFGGIRYELAAANTPLLISFTADRNIRDRQAKIRMITVSLRD